jgi:hypothetical protein
MIDAVRVYTTVSREFLGSETLGEIRFVFTEREPMERMKLHLNQIGGNHTLTPL